MPRKIDGLKKYLVLLDERELTFCKRQMLKIDIRNFDIVSNTSKMLRYLVRLGSIAPDLLLDSEIKDELREDLK